MAEPVALAALLIDATIGWPRGLYERIGHPVGFFARVISWCERSWNRTDRSDTRRRLGGVATVAILIALVGGAGWLAQAAILHAVGPAGWPLIALLAFPAMAQRSLHDHVRAVAKPLLKGDLPAAREAVGKIVGRDSETLDESGVSRAAIESLAESFCDGVAAPLFWLVLLGLPGTWVYKAINTADSLIGHREEPWRMFGWAAARTDDLMNLVPARLAGAAICLAGGGGLRIMARDARRHASPNAGWPEAAMAGALQLRLAGPVVYEGIRYEKPWIGEGSPDAGAVDIDRALGIYTRACLILWLLAALPAAIGCILT